MASVIREEDTGVVVHQATEEPQPKSNIYCEIPYCSADSRVFVYERQDPERAPNSTEYVLCEFGTWKTQVVGHGLTAPAITHGGMFYFRTVVECGGQDLVRLNLASGATDTIHQFPEGFRHFGLGTMSCDERYYAYGVVFSYDPQRFGIEVVDMREGTRDVIHEDPYICNPHTQFEPSRSKQVMVQHNRGCQFLPDGTRVRNVGPEGATEFLLGVPDGKVIRLQLGPPFTPPTTGHEAWIGDTEEILVSLNTSEGEGRERGNLYAVGPGSPARIVSKGYRFTHVNASVCGRFFCCDDRSTGGVVVGSITTGRSALICRSESSFGSEQPTHPHPYLSPDLKWVVFNSDRTGVTQIHAASVPDGLLASLEN